MSDACFASIEASLRAFAEIAAEAFDEPAILPVSFGASELAEAEARCGRPLPEPLRALLLRSIWAPSPEVLFDDLGVVTLDAPHGVLAANQAFAAMRETLDAIADLPPCFVLGQSVSGFLAYALDAGVLIAVDDAEGVVVEVGELLPFFEELAPRLAEAVEGPGDDDD